MLPNIIRKLFVRHHDITINKSTSVISYDTMYISYEAHCSCGDVPLLSEFFYFSSRPEKVAFIARKHLDENNVENAAEKVALVLKKENDKYDPDTNHHLVSINELAKLSGVTTYVGYCSCGYDAGEEAMKDPLRMKLKRHVFLHTGDMESTDRVMESVEG